VVPESRKHPPERPITNRSGQQYPGEIAAGRTCNSRGAARRRHARAGHARKAHAKTKEDAVAVVIEANRELAPPSCLPAPFLPPSLPTPAPHLSAPQVRHTRPQSRGCSRIHCGGGTGFGLQPLHVPTYRSTACLDECHTLPIFTASRTPRLASRLRYSCE